MNRQRLAGLLLGCMLSGIAAAEAPVVDDSERFAAREASDPWNDTTHTDTRPALEESPLAHEDTPSRQAHTLNRINRFNTLQRELQELRGQLEVQAHELKTLKEQQLTFYKDLDSRLQASKSEPLAPATTSPIMRPPTGTLQNQAPLPLIEAQTAAPHPTARSNPADEQLSYMEAYERVKNREYDEALLAMQEFVEHYPHGGYTANAHYWLGELYLVKKNYTQAIEHFKRVLTQFPGSSKIAASTLKIGYALAASGKPTQARQHLQQVIKNYPDTPTAQLATAKLRSLHYT